MNDRPPTVECISAVTLVTADMASSFAFYRQLGFVARYGGPDASFTSYQVGPGYLNVQLDTGWVPRAQVWGRVILYVDDVDGMHDRALLGGLAPRTAPADAPWGCLASRGEGEGGTDRSASPPERQGTVAGILVGAYGTTL